MNTRESNAGIELGRRERLLVLGFWLIFGLIESTNAYVNVATAGGEASWSTALVNNIPWWLMWAALTPVVVWLARQFRFDDGHSARAAFVHFGAMFAVAAVHTLVVGWLFYMTANRGLVFPLGRPTTLDGPFVIASLWRTYRSFLGTYLVVNLATYWVMVGGYYAFEFYKRYREEELRAARMRAHLTEARLNALRTELNPHFLFNTLNAISGLVRRSENEAAVRMLARLGDLLRMTLERGGDHRVPLEQELELLRVYLEIERVRFHDRLSVEMDVDRNALDGMVPTLILQPLVENAVRHGIAPRLGAGRIRVGAERRNGELVLEVADSGAGFQGDGGRTPDPGAASVAAAATDADGGDMERNEGGVGLTNTRERLAELYGERAVLSLGVAPEGGGLVRLVLPYEPFSGGGAALRA
ncbi:MAG: histidine kinase [Gemmatimonadota bacterium]